MQRSGNEAVFPATPWSRPARSRGPGRWGPVPSAGQEIPPRPENPRPVGGVTGFHPPDRKFRRGLKTEGACRALASAQPPSAWLAGTLPEGAERAGAAWKRGRRPSPAGGAPPNGPQGRPTFCTKPSMREVRTCFRPGAASMDWGRNPAGRPRAACRASRAAELPAGCLPCGRSRSGRGLAWLRAAVRSRPGRWRGGRANVPRGRNAASGEGKLLTGGGRIRARLPAVVPRGAEAQAWRVGPSRQGDLPGAGCNGWRPRPGSRGGGDQTPTDGRAANRPMWLGARGHAPNRCRRAGVARGDPGRGCVGDRGPGRSSGAGQGAEASR